MRIDMPITKERIRNHFQYNLWKYLVLIVASVLFWNFLHAVTRYQVPGNAKLEFYAEGSQNSEAQQAMEKMMETIHKTAMPKMEEVSYTLITLDETYGAMQLTVWTAAGEGDVYLLTRENFQQMAQSGAVLNLQPYVDDNSLHVEGLNLASGTVRDAETGEMLFCGIPADSLTGLKAMGLAVEGGFLSILHASENEQEAIVFLNYLLDNMTETDAL